MTMSLKQAAAGALATTAAVVAMPQAKVDVAPQAHVQFANNPANAGFTFNGVTLQISFGSKAAAQGRGNGNPNNSAPTGCSGGNCGGHGGTTINNSSSSSTSNKTNIAVAPGMALSSGWCMESFSVSLGVPISEVPLALGLSKAEFEKNACPKWWAIGQAAGNPNCVPAMTALYIATDFKPIEATKMAVKACFVKPYRAGPKPRG